MDIRISTIRARLIERFESHESTILSRDKKTVLIIK